MAQRPGRVDVAERLEPGPGLGRRQPGRLGRQPGHRVEQRPVEQLLVQPPDLAGVAAPLLVELGRRVGADTGDRGLEPRLVRPVIEPHRPAQPAKYGGILGQGVGAAEPVQLQQVLGAAQEPVGGAEFVRVGPADVAARGQRGQRGQRRGRAQRLVGAAVHQLQQLDGELDVAQPAGAELELASGLPGRQRLLHPAPHGLHVLDEVLAAGRLPDQRAEGVRVGLAERHVARHRPGLEQRLELPGLGPALVVGQVAGQRADQRAGPAFRPQVRVDGEDAAFRGGPRADPDQPGGEAAGGGQRRGLVLVLDRFGHEDHVDVAGVVELAAAALAHGHHGQAAGRRAGRQFGPGHGERRLQDRGRDVGQFLAHLVHGRGPGQVARGEVQQPTPVRRGQRRRGLPARRHRAVRVQPGSASPGSAPTARSRSARSSAASGRVTAPRRISASSGCRARWSARPALTPSTAVSRSRKSCSARSAARRASLPAGGAEQPGQAGQGQVGVGRGRDRGHQRVGPQLGRGHAEVGEQQGLGPRRIRESHPRQPPCQRGPRATHLEQTN